MESRHPGLQDLAEISWSLKSSFLDSVNLLDACLRGLVGDQILGRIGPATGTVEGAAGISVLKWATCLGLHTAVILPATLSMILENPHVQTDLDTLDLGFSDIESP